MNELTNIVFRSAVIYLFIILAIRISGKKELAQLSVIDLVFILLISNAVQNAMIGNNSSLFGGIVAATSLLIVNIVLDILFFHSKKLSELFRGNQTFGEANPKLSHKTNWALALPSKRIIV
jgi:uncharacterized membrane protein YcaP (DUF421 family)